MSSGTYLKHTVLLLFFDVEQPSDWGVAFAQNLTVVAR